MITLALVRRALASYRPTEAREAGAALAAVALILVPGHEGLDILFIRRAERPDDRWSGQVAFPGGRHEPTDRDLRTTAIRETREETGVVLRPEDGLGALDDLSPRTPTLPRLLVRPFVFVVAERPPLASSAEVERGFWVPLARLADPTAQSTVTLAAGGTERTFPAYLVDGELIWGMTERIVTQFLALTRQV